MSGFKNLKVVTGRSYLGQFFVDPIWGMGPWHTEQEAVTYAKSWAVENPGKTCHVVEVKRAFSSTVSAYELEKI